MGWQQVTAEGVMAAEGGRRVPAGMSEDGALANSPPGSLCPQCFVQGALGRSAVSPVSRSAANQGG